MKTAIAAALLTLTSTAHAAPLDGQWSGTLRPVANTCQVDASRHAFRESYDVHGSRLDKVAPKTAGTFHRVTPHTYRMRLTMLDRAEIHFDSTGTAGTEIVTYTDEFGRCHAGDGRVDCECQTVWQGVFVRANE